MRKSKLTFYDRTLHFQECAEISLGDHGLERKKIRVTRVPKAGGKGEKTLKLSEISAGDAMLSDREFSGIGLTVADLCNL